MQYALYIAGGENPPVRKWYQNLSTWLLILQVVLVSTSQILGFYYSVDASGVYHREDGYFIHSLISLTMLAYSSIMCLIAAHNEKDEKRRIENRFVALIIIIPVLGNIFQFFIYGYPTVWLCMAFMVFTVYIHIQNKRTNTERELYNKQLEKALKETKQANEAKTQFLAKISHDMRTPMNTIINLTRMVKEELDDENAVLSDLKNIELSNDSLLGLINDVLDMSQIESGKLELRNERYSYQEFLNYLHCNFDELAKQKNIELIITPGNEYVDIITDKVRFNQICFNLISNAIKYTEPGGHVTFLMNHQKPKNGILPCEIIVKDDGIGMSEDFQKHMFAAFEQENRSFKTVEGVGLGLAIVKSILDAMGATITIESKENVGTICTIHMEMILAKDEPIKELKQNDLSVLIGKHILVAEDHPMNQQIVERLLEKVGLTVSIANNGKEALDMFSNPQNHYDAILMDLRMPVMDGLDASKEIRKLNKADAKSVPIIAVTANTYSDDVKDCINAGMSGHISKPIEPNKLYDILVKSIKQ